MPRFYVFTALVAVTALSCSDLISEEVVESPRSHGFPIINGDPPNAPMHDAVVALHERFSSSSVNPFPFCSGTLIAPDVVISAGHCVDVGRRKRPRAMDPQDLAIYVGNNPTVGNPTFRSVVEVYLHPDYDSRELWNDISLIRLSQPVPSSLAVPVPALPASLGFNSGDVGVTTLNFAGFGDDEHGNWGVKLQADGLFGGFGCSVSGCYGADDDDTQFSYNQFDSGPCFGDSGGPAFVMRNGSAYVGGLTSWGDSGCVVFGVSTRVDAFGAEIADFIGTTGDVCGDGVCTGDEDCASCSGDCGACPFCGDGTCDSGESCGSCSTDCGACPTCGGNKASCSVNSDCCSGNCRSGKCRGN